MIDVLNATEIAKANQAVEDQKKESKTGQGTAANKETPRSTWKPVLADFGDNKSGKKLTLYLPTDGIVHGSTKLTLVKTTPTLQQERTPVVTLAYWNLSRLWTLGGAVAATALLFLLVTQLLKLQPKGNPALAGTHLNWFQRFLLDPETNTYSLSYLQLFLWSATSIVAYLTLVIARALVQGAVEWPDIPGNLPGLIFISAGTTALAEGITAIKGPKGGGPSEPNWTDLISNGGVVAVDRVQFFVWTVLGVGVFLFYLLLSDPITMTTVPTVPQGFLQIMGISSTGYLGTKLGRRPGPVLETATITSAAGASQVALTVKGTGLSPRAQWNVQRSATPPIPPVELTPADMINGKPTIVQPPPSAGPEPEFATELNLTLTPTNPKAANIVAEAKLTIRNPDGRIAEVLIK